MTADDSTGDSSVPLSVQERIHETSEGFIAAWTEFLNGDGSVPPRPRIDDFLSEFKPPERSALFSELLDVDLASRRKMGERARETVREKFLLSRLLEQYLDLFASFETVFRLRM